jgi:hypothetical protein
MTQEQFYHQACLKAMEGLLASSGHYRGELIKNPCEYVATAARHYATELTEQVFGGGEQWKEITHTPEQTCILENGCDGIRCFDCINNPKP